MPYRLNIPQNLVEFNDGGLAFKNDYDTITTKSVLVLGKSIDGPADPTAVSIDTVATLFGKDVDMAGISNGGTITTAVNDLYRAGCRDIRAMKISGSCAKAEVSGPSKNIATIEKKECEIGFVEGNEATTLTLNNSGIISDSILVYVDDKILSCNFTFDSAASVITIPAGVCRANGSVSVKYSYNAVIPDSKFEEVLVVSADNTITLEKTPKSGSVTVLLNDVIIPVSNYTIADKVITFITSSRSKRNVVSENDIVSVEYLADDNIVKSASDNSHAGVPFVSGTAMQVITLKETPNKNTTILYCNEKEVAKRHYAVSGNKINIKKEQLIFGGNLTITYLVNKSENSKSVIELESFFTSSIYNGGSVEVAEILNADGVLVGKQVVIEKPKEKQAIGEKPLSYSSVLYPTFGAIVNAINSDLRGGVYKASTDNPEELTSTLNLGKVNFSGGDSGINSTSDELKEALSGKRDEEGYLLEDGVYQLLEGYNVDYIVLTGVYADDVVSSKEGFAYDLAMHCAMSSRKNKTIFGAIAVSPCRNTSLKGIKDYIDRLSRWNYDGREFLLKDNGKIVEDSNGKPIDLGMYVRVVGGTEPYYLNDDLGKHPANPAIVYIGLQSMLNSQSSPLNKALQNSKGLRYRLTEGQLSSLTRANIITFMLKSNNKGKFRDEAYVFDSMTQALPDSDYVRTTACEVVRLISDDIREIADPYIGEPPTVESKNSFAAALSKRFAQRKQEGAVYDLGFEIIETPQMSLIGDCNVNTTIVTTGERRRINTTVGLKPAL